jgi:hypothetical protein
MTTGYDTGGIIPRPGLDDQAKTTLPALQICTHCGQAAPAHLTVCPVLPQLPSSAIPEQTIEAVNDEEKKLGEAV